MQKNNLTAEQIGLEITEGILVEEIDLVQKVFNELKALKIRLAIDDFGTGYSSLSYLKRFPIHSIKIDQSFIRDIPENKEDCSLVQTIIAIGNSLNMKVIAEGVETEEQFNALKQWGCQSIQGFYFGKAIPEKAFIVKAIARSQISNLAPVAHSG